MCTRKSRTRHERLDQKMFKQGLMKKPIIGWIIIAAVLLAAGSTFYLHKALVSGDSSLKQVEKSEQDTIYTIKLDEAQFQAFKDAASFNSGLPIEDPLLGSAFVYQNLSDVSSAVCQSTSSSQSFCYLTNSGDDRILIGADLKINSVVATATALTRYTLNAGNFVASVATSTGVNLLFDGWITPSAVSSTLMATSTLMSTHRVWHSGETIRAMINSPTSTLSGKFYLYWLK